MRLAQTAAEVDALAARIDSANASAAAGDFQDILSQLGDAVANESVAIIARPLRVISDLVENENITYSTYHQQVAGQARVPADNSFDRTRTQYENALFPNFFMEIRFGALTLDGQSVKSFGEYSMVLKDAMISRRSSTFEENPHVFMERHAVLMNQEIPHGYRASWPDRGELAKAKLYPELKKTTKPDEFASLLMKEGTGAADDDFIEVHIYGPFNRNTIEKVIGPRPHTREDKMIWRRMARIADSAGIAVEER